MAQVTTLAAEERATKGTARALRRQGRVPGVIYGDKQQPLSVALEVNILARQLERPGFTTHLFDLEIDGKKHRVLPRDVQFDPVTDRPLHVDFLRVSAATMVRVHVPVAFLNAEKSPGIKRGGTLNIVHHEIEIMCSPEHIPEKFEISLEGLQINDAVHLSKLKLPEGVKLTTHEKDFTIATIAVPSAIRAEAEEAAAAAAAAAASAAAATAEGAIVPGAEGAVAATAAAAAASGAKGAAPAAGAAAPAAGAKGAAPAADAKKPEGKK
jgi:large subunit ribosomal protein L25